MVSTPWSSVQFSTCSKFFLKKMFGGCLSLQISFLFFFIQHGELQTGSSIDGNRDHNKHVLVIPKTDSNNSFSLKLPENAPALRKQNFQGKKLPGHVLG